MSLIFVKHQGAHVKPSISICTLIFCQGCPPQESLSESSQLWWLRSILMNIQLIMNISMRTAESTLKLPQGLRNIKKQHIMQESVMWSFRLPLERHNNFSTMLYFNILELPEHHRQSWPNKNQKYNTNIPHLTAQEPKIFLFDPSFRMSRKLFVLFYSIFLVTPKI